MEHKSSLSDADEAFVGDHTTIAERLKMVWPLTLDCWAFVPETQSHPETQNHPETQSHPEKQRHAEQEFQRHVVSVQRGRS